MLEKSTMGPSLSCLAPKRVCRAVCLALGLIASSTPSEGFAASPRATQGASAPAAPFPQAPLLSGTDLLLAYSHLTGMPPDYQDLAQRSVAYRQASAFQQPSVLERLTASYKAEYDWVSPGKAYSIAISVMIQQYDPARGGFPTDFTDDHFVPIPNPLGQSGFQLGFDNIASFNVVPVPAATAEAFALRHGLSLHGSLGGFGQLRLVFTIVAAPPALDAASFPVTAHIVSGELLTSSGGIIYAFPPAPSQPAEQDFGNSKMPVLKSSSLDGVEIGMNEDAAKVVASSQFPGATPITGPSFAAYFSELRGGSRPTCGRPRPFNPTEGFMTQAEDPFGQYKACLSFDIQAAKVTAVHSIQWLAGSDPTSVGELLDAKYGKPAFNAAETGSRMEKWVGTNAGGQPVEVEASFSKVNATGAGIFVRLRIDVHPWTDPHAKSQQPSGSGNVPKL